MKRLLVTLILILLFAPVHGWSQDPDGNELVQSPQLILKGFTDISYGVNQDENDNTFSLGQFDLFITSALSDKFTFLSEVVFKFGKDNSGSFDSGRKYVVACFSTFADPIS